MADYRYWREVLWARRCDNLTSTGDLCSGLVCADCGECWPSASFQRCENGHAHISLGAAVQRVADVPVAIVCPSCEALNLVDALIDAPRTILHGNG